MAAFITSMTEGLQTTFAVSFVMTYMVVNNCTGTTNIHSSIYMCSGSNHNVR